MIKRKGAGRPAKQEVEQMMKQLKQTYEQLKMEMPLEPNTIEVAEQMLKNRHWKDLDELLDVLEEVRAQVGSGSLSEQEQKRVAQYIGNGELKNARGYLGINTPEGRLINKILVTPKETKFPAIEALKSKLEELEPSSKKMKNTKAEKDKSQKGTRNERTMLRSFIKGTAKKLKQEIPSNLQKGMQTILKDGTVEQLREMYSILKQLVKAEEEQEQKQIQAQKGTVQDTPEVEEQEKSKLENVEKLINVFFNSVYAEVYGRCVLKVQTGENWTENQPEDLWKSNLRIAMKQALTNGKESEKYLSQVVTKLVVRCATAEAQQNLSMKK